MEPTNLGFLLIGLCAFAVGIRILYVNNKYPNTDVPLETGSPIWEYFCTEIEAGRFPELHRYIIAPKQYETLMVYLRLYYFDAKIGRGEDVAEEFNYYSKYLLSRVKGWYEMSNN